MELTVGQARAIAAIRARMPDAQLTLHERPWGCIVEVREPRGDAPPRTVALARFGRDGAIRPDTRVLGGSVGA